MLSVVFAMFWYKSRNAPGSGVVDWSADLENASLCLTKWRSATLTQSKLVEAQAQHEGLAR